MADLLPLYQKQDPEALLKLLKYKTTTLTPEQQTEWNTYRGSSAYNKDITPLAQSESKKYLDSWDARLEDYLNKSRTERSKALTKFKASIKPLTSTSTTEVTPGTDSKTSAPVVIATSSTPSTLTPKQPQKTFSLEQFQNHKNFRKHHTYKLNTIIIDGKEYPVMVTTGLFGNNYGLENDRAYVFDLATGKVRKVKEGMWGNLKNAFADESDWVDLTNLYTNTIAKEKTTPTPSYAKKNPYEQAYKIPMVIKVKKQGGQLISKKAKGGGLTKKYFTGGQAHVGVSIPLNKPKDMRVSVGGLTNFGKVNQSVEASVLPFRKNWNVGSSTGYSSGNTSISMPISLGGNSKGIQNWRVSPNFNIADSKRNINHSLALGLSGNRLNSFLDANYSTSLIE